MGLAQLKRRVRARRQEVELLKANENYRRDLGAVRERWGIPPEGFTVQEELDAWQSDLVKAVNRSIDDYWALQKKAFERGRSQELLSALRERAERENPRNRLMRDLQTLDERYGLGEDFHWDCGALVTDFHLGDCTIPGFGIVTLDITPEDPPRSTYGIPINAYLTQRDLLERWSTIQYHQEKCFGRVASGGRPKRGEDRSLVIGEREGRYIIQITPHLSKAMLKREWPRIKALQRKLWPNYKRRHYQPSHSRRMTLITLGGLESEPRYRYESDLLSEDAIRIGRTLAIVAELWKEGDAEADRRRAALLRKDRERLRKRFKRRK